MTLEEFYHLSKEESFKRIKEECRSQAKRRLCWSLICLLILIVLIIYIRIWNHREFDIADDILTCMYVIICILAGWVAVNNFWLLKKVDNIDTPEQLLHAYEKTLKSFRNAGCIAIILGVIDPYAFLHDKGWILLSLAVSFIFIAFFIYTFFKDYWGYKTRRDEEIIDRLQDLIDMK